MIETLDKTFSFAAFEVDAARRRVTKDGAPVALNPKAFDLLLILIESRGVVLSKNDLLERIWADQFVEENNLTVHISALRKIFGEKKGDHNFIVTVPGKGYKFVADVRVSDETEKEIVIENHTFSRVIIEETAEAKENDEAERGEHQILPASKTSHSWQLVLYGGAAIVFVLAIALSFWLRSGESEFDARNYNLTKLTTSGKITNAALAPDGKYVVFAQTEIGGESLHLRHVATGSQKEILPAKPVRFVGLAVTPEGNQIYATIFSPALADPQIWRVPLLGGSTEEVIGVTTGAAVSFSPAGDQMAFVESRSRINENHLLISDADGANKRILMRAVGDARSLTNFNANPVAWSPGGDEIACAVDEKDAAGKMKAGIVLIDPAAGGERFVSEKRWDYVENLTWTDADNLAFVAYTTEPWQSQIWTISKKTGETRPITNDTNSYSWLGSAGGNLLSVQKNAVSYISIGDFDENNNHLKPREIYSESGYVDNAVWTSDEGILYLSGASGKREIWRVKADGSNRSQITVNANVGFGFAVSPVDGSIVYSANEDGKYSLKMMNADGKNVRPLTEGAEDAYPNFTADGQTVVFQRGVRSKTFTMWRVALADKNPVQITQTHGTHPAVSPDGARVAHYFMDADTDNIWRIRLVSTLDGTNRGKMRFPRSITERRMRWHPNGKYIGQIFYEGENIKLLLLPTAGGDEEPQIVSGLGRGDVNWFEWSPDGRQIVVAHTTETQDVVLLSK